MTQYPGLTLTNLDFQQESLDFASLSALEFEHLIFHMIDEMGFSNLVWRKGGRSNTSADGGRDIEATYWQVEPIGSKELRYWFEVKYRSNQLEKSQVQKAVHDASAHSGLDHVVIATNSTVSNPCIDWIQEFQTKYPRPLISVWQGHDLELLLLKNPRTLAKFLPTSLSFSGRCKVIESRLLNLFLLPSVDELCELWRNRDCLDAHRPALLAAILAESSFGNLAERPWGMAINKELLLDTALRGVCGFYLMVRKIDTLNRREEPLIEGIVYLVGCLLVRVGHEIAARILYDAEKLLDVEIQLPEELRSYRARTILVTLYDQLAVYCSSANSCRKLDYRDPEETPDYFARFWTNGPTKEEDQRFLIMDSKAAECELGLVPVGCYCPLSEEPPETELTAEKVRERLAFAEGVLVRRMAELRSPRKGPDPYGF